MTDHGSHEGSRAQLAAAIELVTGNSPLLVDARHFMTGATGRATSVGGELRLEIPEDGVVASPDVLVIYEIPPAMRRRFEPFQLLVRDCRTPCLGTQVDGWRNATEKDRTVAVFGRHGIPQMETICLRRPSERDVLGAFDRLGRNVWARPTIGLGGGGVFHVDRDDQLLDATAHYARNDEPWLMARDAHNFNPDGLRQQFRVVVMGERVLRVCEHVQPDIDAPCNESRGAVSTVLPVEEVPDCLLDLAIAATRAVGLSFGGVDLATHQDGVVFEVNVHPVITGGALETVAVPFVEAHLTHAVEVVEAREDHWNRIRR